MLWQLRPTTYLRTQVDARANLVGTSIYLRTQVDARANLVGTSIYLRTQVDARANLVGTSIYLRTQVDARANLVGTSIYLRTQVDARGSTKLARASTCVRRYVVGLSWQSYLPRTTVLSWVLVGRASTSYAVCRGS